MFERKSVFVAIAALVLLVPGFGYAKSPDAKPADPKPGPAKQVPGGDALFGGNLRLDCDGDDCEAVLGASAPASVGATRTVTPAPTFDASLPSYGSRRYIYNADCVDVTTAQVGGPPGFNDDAEEILRVEGFFVPGGSVGVEFRHNFLAWLIGSETNATDVNRSEVQSIVVLYQWRPNGESTWRNLTEFAQVGNENTQRSVFTSSGTQLTLDLSIVTPPVIDSTGPALLDFRILGLVTASAGFPTTESGVLRQICNNALHIVI